MRNTVPVNFPACKNITLVFVSTTKVGHITISLVSHLTPAPISWAIIAT